MKSSIKNSGEIQTKEPYIKCKWCIYALCSKILIVKKHEQKRGVKYGLYKKTFRSTRPAHLLLYPGRRGESGQRDLIQSGSRQGARHRRRVRLGQVRDRVFDHADPRKHRKDRVGLHQV